MINYIVILTSVIALAVLLKIAYGLAKRNQWVLAGAMMLAGISVLSGSTWYIFDSTAEIKAPGPDITAAASSSFIESQPDAKVTGIDSSQNEPVSYSGQNQQDNRKAVERFKSLPSPKPE